MGLMTFLRNRAGYILIGAIGFAIVAFLVGDAINVGKPFWAESQKVVGSIDGEEINIDQFGPKVDQSLAQFKQQYGGSGNAQMQAMAVDNVWQGEVANVLLGKEYTRLGLTVSAQESFDLVQGPKPSPLIVQYFGNPQTGEFDRNQVIKVFKEGLKDPKMKPQLLAIEAEIIKQTLQIKYTNLIRNSVYVTSLEANDEYVGRNKVANFKYVGLDFASVPDASVKLTDADYSDFYDKNKKRFENPTETRTFEYVSFSVNPTKEDSAAVKAQIEKLAVDFRTAANDSLFAAVNSDVKVPFVYINKGKLDPAVDSAVFNLPAGSFYGPAFSGTSYKLVKVVSTRFSPDSVKASHILLDASKMGGVDVARKMADSLKTLVQKGASFAALALQYSVDGSKDKGGEMPAFARGQMVPEFENAAFDGSVGDLKVVTSQFGVHLMKIEKQIGSSKVAKLAYIEKNLESSNKTKDAAYKKASTFLSEVKDGNFAELAQKKGYTVAVADKITPTQGFAPGLDNPRQLIRDAYNADQGDVLDQVYQMDNAFVIARVTAIRPKGTLPLEAVKKDIEPMVRNAVKSRMLKEKMDQALQGAANINQVAQKLGKPVMPVQNIVFASPIVPGASQENKLVGTVFGSQPGKLSKSIEGDAGVYAFVVDGFGNPAPLANTYKQKETMMQTTAQRALGAAFQALQDKSKIKDNRVKFY
ncbi:peptidylprolyl isomerase [Pedobacter metabolipauper]|uniref:Periplasmic chaperone PpiD n=1 Tax=Pedobacter metabolipauper TaxID=425513 RepID=A0A4V3D1A1_9SPHI|nr:SurA N-terminal domain-containing protein [Pedobacter metabolipauper]TDQ09867.1 peptidyl-prolyl cis-trans isomerase D [Pedobacter metabolipauper]